MPRKRSKSFCITCHTVEVTRSGTRCRPCAEARHAAQARERRLKAGKVRDRSKVSVTPPIRGARADQVVDAAVRLDGAVASLRSAFSVLQTNHLNALLATPDAAGDDKSRRQVSTNPVRDLVEAVNQHIAAIEAARLDLAAATAGARRVKQDLRTRPARRRRPQTPPPVTDI